MSDAKLISNLDSIVKQLQKIAATIGISVGVSSDKSGKPKIKSVLDSNEKTRARNLFKETEQQYESVLGRAFSATRNADAREYASEFIAAINRTSLINNIESVKTTIQSLANSTGNANYTSFLTRIDENIDKLAKGQKDYEPKFNELLIALGGVQTNIKDTSIKPQNTIRMWGVLLKKMKWEDFRVMLTDYFTRAEQKTSEINQYLSDLVQINRDILTKSSSKQTGSTSGLSKIGNIAGIAALGVGLVFVVNALLKSNLIDTENVLKILGVVGAIIATFLLVSSISGKLKQAAVGFGIFSATILFIILPMIYALTKLGIITIVFGLFKLGMIVTACFGILKLMEKIKSNDVINQTKGLSLFALMVGFLIIPLIAHLTTITTAVMIEGLIKLAVLVGACYGILKLMERIKPTEVIKSVAGLSLFSLVLGFLVIPLLVHLSSLNWAVLLKGLANASIAIIGIGLIALVMGQLAKIGAKNMLVGAATIAILTFTLGYLADNLEKLAGKNWTEIYKGLGLATLAISLFGLAVFGIGMAVFGPQALLIAAGAATVLALSFVVGYLADSLAKFSGKNWDEITYGLKESIKAISVFGAVLTGIGLASILAAPLIAAGSTAVMFLANTAGLLAANLEEFAGRDWDNIITGLMGASIGMGIFSTVVTTMGAIIKNFGMDMVVQGSNAILIMSIVAGELAQNLMKFAYKPWTNIIKGLTQSTIAISKFSLLVGAVGIFSKIIEKGTGLMYDVSNLIGNIADNLMKYEGVENINFEKIGKGLNYLGQGLNSMLFGSFSNVGSTIIDSIAGFFGMDPVSKIKRFETIDAEKMYKLGSGLKFMGEGLNMLTKDLNLNNLINDLTLLSKPVLSLANSISEFSDSYSKLQALQMESDINQIKNVNLEAENGIKDEIKLANELQLEVLNSQLSELRRNNELMEILVSRGSNNQNNNTLSPYVNQKSSKDSITFPTFSTKDNYRNNLKLVSMSLQV